MRPLLVVVVLLGLMTRAQGQALCPEPGCVPIYPNGVLMKEITAPGTPPGGQDWIYAISGQVCSKNSSGTITCMGTGGGGGGPTGFDTIQSGTNTGATMQCTAPCQMSGNIIASALANLPFACTSPAVANSIAANGNLGCTQVSIPMLATGTSAQLAAVISDETGWFNAGSQLVFSTSPTILSAGLSGIPSVYAEAQLIDQSTIPISPPAGSNVYIYARNNNFCWQGNQGGEHCGMGVGTGNVMGPGPSVVANSIATFNGTGGTTIQASPCTIDATGLEDCPQPTGTTQGAVVIKEGQTFGVPGFTYTLTLGSGALANNFVCAIDVATGGIPGSCLDTVPIASGGTGQTTKTAAFDALAPTTTKGDLVVNNGTNNVRQAAGADGLCVVYDATQATGVKAASCGAGASVPGVASAATSSWSCTAATGGAFIDTDCNVFCDCNPVALKFCRSDTGACLSATDCCAPTTSTTTTTTSTTTTTTAGATAPNWTSSFLAVWLMEEATDGPWASQINSTTRDFQFASIPGNHATKDTTNKMQGTASVSGNGTVIELATTGATGDALENPTLTNGLSFGCWARDTHNDSSGTETLLFGSMVGTGAGTGGGFGIEEVDVSPRWRAISSYNGGVILADPGAADGTTRGAFTHAVGVYHRDPGAGSDSISTYVNGQASKVQTGTAGVRIMTGSNQYVTGFTIENVSTGRAQVGNLDECFVIALELPATDVCRICSCGIDGSLCTCSGTSYTSSGRRTTSCNTCTLPNCNQATP
jgi:hypothetical protein